MQRIALFANLQKPGTADLLRRAVDVLRGAGFACLLPDAAPVITGCETLPPAQLYERCDAVVTIGGDGTLLRHAAPAARAGKPLLGVNAGRVGYLADLDPQDLDRLAALRTGDYRIEPRMMLDVRVGGGQEAAFLALNEAVISKGALSKMIDLTASIGADAVSYRADGLILSTPTGSTAYSMSAGGPIVDPAIESVTLTPICPYAVFARPILLHSATVVRVTVLPREDAEIYLTVDGANAYRLTPGAEVSKAACALQLIRICDHTFFHTLSHKLDLKEQERKR